MKKRKEKRRKITLLKGGKGLTNASFLAINSKKFCGGSFEEKKLSRKRGGGNDQKAQYISL